MTDDPGAAYGRSGDDWDAVVPVARQFLIEQSRLGQKVSYTELNAVLGLRSTFRQFDFDLSSERAAIGHLLGRIVAADRPESGVMLSAVVWYLNGSEAGPGFYDLAVELGLLRPNATDDEKLTFWFAELGRVHADYGPRRRR